MTRNWLNPLRWRAVIISREYKTLCLGDKGELKRSAEHVLADLRAFCIPPTGTPFNRDPVEMARRVGRQEVFDRVQRMLGLSEEQTLKLMEVDDGK